jgi:hypothetical protein
MTAVTLSTIGFRTSVVGEEAAEVVARGAIVGERRFPVVVETLVNVPAVGSTRAGERVQPGHGGGRRGGVDPEHQARGLLNLVALVSRLLRDGAATPDERRQWLEDLEGANERLEALYRAGLSREFMSTAPATTVFTR